jgi:hypothetical protein
MAVICDRSPCDQLMTALGRYVFGAVQGNVDIITLEVLTPQGHDTALISYCPFCGTRLDEIGPGLLDRFLPKKVDLSKQSVYVGKKSVIANR